MKNGQKNYVIGFYQTKFGELWEKSLFDLVSEAIFGVLKTVAIEKERIDAVFFGNMLAGVLENNLHSSAKIAEVLGVNIPVFRVEAACASGGTAFHLACQYLNQSSNKTVLVIGVEKMNDYSPDEITQALSSAASGDEQEIGVTFPGLYALLANYYLNQYHYDEESLAYVSVKNHYHGSLNEKAHFQKPITLDQVLKSPYVAYPLKVLDSSPISDGAAALLLTNDQNLVKRIDKKISCLASAVATDTINLSKRKNLDQLLATKISAEEAFAQAKIFPKNINVAELHDCFSIAEILAMEDIGFWKKGEGGRRIKDEETKLGNGGSLIVNPSGGLKAAGHPVGATGIKQIGEIFLQLTNQAGKKQVKGAKYGLTHNVGGSGGTAVISIFTN
jgi:acetyl-CoA C-acetyltransferase